jgi:hypothetical protein
MPSIKSMKNQIHMGLVKLQPGTVQGSVVVSHGVEAKKLACTSADNGRTSDVTELRLGEREPFLVTPAVDHGLPHLCFCFHCHIAQQVCVQVHNKIAEDVVLPVFQKKPPRSTTSMSTSSAQAQYILATAEGDGRTLDTGQGHPLRVRDVHTEGNAAVALELLCAHPLYSWGGLEALPNKFAKYREPKAHNAPPLVIEYVTDHYKNRCGLELVDPRASALQLEPVSKAEVDTPRVDILARMGAAIQAMSVACHEVKSFQILLSEQIAPVAAVAAPQVAVGLGARLHNQLLGHSAQGQGRGRRA